jgi:2'-5' RNA ligase
MIAESALAVLVPEAEMLVGSYRAAYDPSAARGMPAHITVLYPFLSPDAIDDGVLDRLRRCCARFTAFDFALTTTRRFPDRVLYLAVEPDEPFRQLTLAIWETFPQNPPYGGLYPVIVPHLTVADGQEAFRLDEIDRDFEPASRDALPIRAHADEVMLLNTGGGLWQQTARFPLGQPTR